MVMTNEEREYFELQLKQVKPYIPEDSEIVQKFYYSGRPILPGDKILFALLATNNNSLTLIEIHEDEIGVEYEIQYTGKIDKNNLIPRIILKRNKR